MNEVRATFSDIELCAYLDGEMAAERCADIDAWLARHPEARAKVETWRRQGHMMRASFGRIAQEPLPRQMTAALPQQTEPPKVAAIQKLAPQPVRKAAAPALRVGNAAQPALRAGNAGEPAMGVGNAGEPALLARPAPATPRSLWRSIGIGILGLSALTGVLASGILQKIGGEGEPRIQLAAAAPGFSLIRHAMEAHAAFTPRAERLIDVRSADPVVLTAAAVQAGLDARLPRAVAGLRMLGLRLTPGEAGIAGLLLFESEKSGPVSLFVTREARPGATGLILREARGLTVASFSFEGTAYALTGGAPRDQMVDWASALRLSLVQPRSLRGS